MGKVGRGHAAAMGRLGLRELREASSPGGNIVQPPELGLYGTALPSEVADARKEPEKDEAQQPSILARKMGRSKSMESPDRDGPEIEPPEPEME